MAFANKIGSLLKNAVSSKPCIYQALRYMSSSKLFIGGLSFSTDDQSLREAFSGYGEVVEARIIIDRETGRSRGFGFITYTSGEEASAAITAMDGKDLHGRMVRVNYANDRRTGFGGGGGYGGGSYGGGYGGGGGAGGYGSGGGNAGYGADSYGSGGGGYSGGTYGGSGGGGGAGYDRDSYRSGAGEYSSGGAGGSYSWGSGSGGAGYGGAGGNENYVDGAAGQNFASAAPSFGSGGAGGNENYVDGAAGQNFASAAPSFGSSDQHNFKPDGTGGGYHNRNQYSSNQPGNTSRLNYDDRDDLVESFKDDNDEPDGYANKKG